MKAAHFPLYMVLQKKMLCGHTCSLGTAEAVSFPGNAHQWMCLLMVLTSSHLPVAIFKTFIRPTKLVLDTVSAKIPKFQETLKKKIRYWELLTFDKPEE